MLQSFSPFETQKYGMYKGMYVKTGVHNLYVPALSLQHCVVLFRYVVNNSFCKRLHTIHVHIHKLANSFLFLTHSVNKLD